MARTFIRELTLSQKIKVKDMLPGMVFSIMEPDTSSIACWLLVSIVSKCQGEGLGVRSIVCVTANNADRHVIEAILSETGDVWIIQQSL